EYLHLGPFTAEVRPGFIPVNLGFLRPAIALRHEGLAPPLAHLPFAGADMIAHGRFSDSGIREFPQDPAMDAPRGVSLLARRATVFLQYLVNERLYRSQFWLGPLRIAVPRR